ncbi:MAG: HD domain-containing protein [Anaerolineae bacterium]|nr:MAG: HD domain-containing protein [Anaerolineae bacterium]
MIAERILDVLLQANRLKATPRAGWTIRGVAHPESVAAHSYGVALLSLILAQAVEEPLDRAKLLTTALLHDLPESHTTDIPYPALRFIPPEVKRAGELQALDEITNGFPAGDEYRELWLDFEDRRTPEGRLVRDADRLELMLQAYVYEQNTSNRQLQEFWDNTDESYFEYPVCRQVFGLLRQRREKERTR